MPRRRSTAEVGQQPPAWPGAGRHAPAAVLRRLSRRHALAPALGCRGGARVAIQEPHAVYARVCGTWAVRRAGCLQQGSLLVTHKGSLVQRTRLRVLWGLPRRGQPAIPLAQRAAFIPGVRGFARAAGAPQTCEQGVPGVAVQGGTCPPAASAAPLPDCAVAGFASGRLQQSGPAAAQ